MIVTSLPPEGVTFVAVADGGLMVLREDDSGGLVKRGVTTVKPQVISKTSCRRSTAGMDGIVASFSLMFSCQSTAH